MTHTARLALTMVCFVVALAAELMAVALVVSQVRAATKALREWDQPDRAGTPDGPGEQLRQLRGVVRGLLDRSVDRVLTVVLVVTGAVVGAAGDVLALSL